MTVPASSLFDAAPAAAEDLGTIRADLGECRRCKLCRTRTNIVFGMGNANAELMFVGEAPGADEDEQGLPFVGRAGQLLTKIIQAIDMRREEVYICNILKCRPPQNRNPESDEIAACQPFLFRQIAADSAPRDLRARHLRGPDAVAHQGADFQTARDNSSIFTARSSWLPSTRPICCAIRTKSGRSGKMSRRSGTTCVPYAPEP